MLNQTTSTTQTIQTPPAVSGSSDAGAIVRPDRSREETALRDLTSEDLKEDSDLMSKVFPNHLREKGKSTPLSQLFYVEPGEMNKVGRFSIKIIEVNGAMKAALFGVDKNNENNKIIHFGCPRRFPQALLAGQFALLNLNPESQTAEEMNLLAQSNYDRTHREDLKKETIDFSQLLKGRLIDPEKRQSAPFV